MTEQGGTPDIMTPYTPDLSSIPHTFADCQYYQITLGKSLYGGLKEFEYCPCLPRYSDTGDTRHSCYFSTITKTCPMGFVR